MALVCSIYISFLIKLFKQYVAIISSWLIISEGKRQISTPGKWKALQRHIETSVSCNDSYPTGTGASTRAHVLE